MYFILEGRVKNKEVVDIYIQNLLKYLKLDRRRSSELTIKFTTKLPAGVHGLASGGPRWGEIEIAKTSQGEKLQFFEQMLSLAHEMIHIKQYMKGELSTKHIPEKIPYKKQPWEIEAHKMEHELFAKCFPWYLEIN